MKAVLARLWKDAVTYKQFIFAFLAYDAAVMLLFGNFCPSVFITGLPCPGCGTTRAAFYFLTGQFEKGWAMQPLAIGWLMLAAYFGLMRYGLGKKPLGVLQMGAALAVCMAVFYLYRMVRYFPGEAPIAYVEENLLERILPGYRERIDGLAMALERIRIVIADNVMKL